MKKFLSLALALILALSCAAALADVTPSQVVGTWYLQSRFDNDVEYLYNGEYKVEFKRNKTAVFTVDGEEYEYTWEIEGDSVDLQKPDGAEYLYISSDFILEDDLLKLNAENEQSGKIKGLYDFAFGREEPEAALPSLENEAKEEEDFYGEYEAALIYDPNTLWAEKVEEGTAQVAISFAEAKITIGDNSAIIMTDFADGALTLDASALDRSYKNLKVTANLTEKVLLVQVLDVNGETVSWLIFNKIEQ